MNMPSAQTQHDGIGSWHPALRPNSYGPDCTNGNEAVPELSKIVYFDSSPEQDSPSQQLRRWSNVNGQPESTEFILTRKGTHQDNPNSDKSASPGEYKKEDREEPAKYVLGETEGSEWQTRLGQSLTPDEGLADLPAVAESITAAMSPQPRSSHLGGLLSPNQALASDGDHETQGESGLFDLGLDAVKVAPGDKVEMVKAWSTENSYLGLNKPGDLNRTNSFPEIPPLQRSEVLASHTLPHSQAEDIMEEIGSLEPMDHQPPLSVFTRNNVDDGTPFGSVGPIEDERSESLFADARFTSSMKLGDDKSRYEEGLPLMPSKHHADYSSSLRGESHDPEAGEASELERNDDGFFDGDFQRSSDEISWNRPQALDRKSTNQVLDSLRYPQQGTEPESIQERPSLADLTGGGIGVSASTVKSQGFAEQQMNSIDSQSKDEDLAELWEAALGDDELLDDSVDPSSFFEDDGEDFLDGNQDQADESRSQIVSSAPILEPISNPDGSTQGFGKTDTRQAAQQDKSFTTSASQPSVVPGHDQSRLVYNQQQRQVTSGLENPASTQIGFGDAMRQQSYVAQIPSRPSMPPSTQSFADKSKGGYTLPYDLPMDVTRPKKRTHHQQMLPNPDAQIVPTRPPPPRSSSMFTGAPPPRIAHTPVPRLSNSSISLSTGSTESPALQPTRSTNSFFEDLPSSKPRPSSSMGRIVAPNFHPIPPPPTSQPRDQPSQLSTTLQPTSRASEASPQYQLLPPERLSLYGNTSQPEPISQSMAVANTRYSPLPTQQPNVPPPSNRYAASPSLILSRPPQTQGLAFQPRTSSPLAHNSSSTQPNQQASIPDPSLHRTASSRRHGVSTEDPVSSSFQFSSHQSQSVSGQRTEHYERTGKAQKYSDFEESSPNLISIPYVPAQISATNSSYETHIPAADPTASIVSAPLQRTQEFQPSAPSDSNYGPPQRAQTQSPGTGKMKTEVRATIHNPYHRPASANDHVLSASVETNPPIVNQTRPRGRTFSKDLMYVKPSDGSEIDYLERWKGCPIFSFGFGGAIVTSFPKRIPRYTAGQNVPMIKCNPGEVRLQDGKILPVSEDVATFPGPLRLKSKKKDVIDWLYRKISYLENGVNSNASLPDLRKRFEEKTLLWKIIRVMVEHDGAFDGSASAEKAIRSLLSPELTHGDSTSLPYPSSNEQFVGISRGSGSHSISDPVKPEALEDLRRLLLQGEREKAVWHAVDNRLWAHAMLLSSTLDKGLWKQVSQEFVRQDVKTVGQNTESLAALYQIFAGNWDESMDELVPPSARAGLQMVSKTAGTGPAKNALEGLDRWRETVALILSNRSGDDGKALVSLGQLLASYGRTEAAHICYIFANSPGLFGGSDDAQVSVALLGADHLQYPFDFGRDFDSIVLTEVYDFARTVLSPSTVATVSPHLQSYKLYHAMILAEYGYKSEAQQYCEMITSALKSTTKPSPYYHGLLFGALDNLVDRLRQAPRDTAGSWISKPSIDKVSGSIWAKFNQYVAGDESDATSTGSGKAVEQNAGPFARVAGDSPNLSRSPSSSDIYSSNNIGIGVSPSAPTTNPSNSRYAPNGLNTPRSSLEQPGRSSQEYHRSTPSDSLRPAFSHQHHHSRPASSTGSYYESYKPKSQQSAYPSRSDSYFPTPPSQPEYTSVAPPEASSSSLYEQNSYQPTLPFEPTSPQEQHQPLLQSESTGPYQPPSSSYNPPSSTYEPPSINNYQPPPTNDYDPSAYDLHAAHAEESPVENRPKKKSFIDDDEDDDDFEARAAAIRKEDKARRDREVDEAFRKAAEVDGKLP